MGEWVYELFITTLPVEGFLVEDAFDLYHGRGAFEAILTEEDVEEDLPEEREAKEAPKMEDFMEGSDA